MLKKYFVESILSISVFRLSVGNIGTVQLRKKGENNRSFIFLVLNSNQVVMEAHAGEYR